MKKYDGVLSPDFSMYTNYPEAFQIWQVYRNRWCAAYWQSKGIKVRTLFGTKVVNFKTEELGLVLYTWTNVYADSNVPFATCVDKDGKKYNITMDSISPVDE